MLQRVQTIFLFLIASAMILFLFVNVWQKQSVEQAEHVTLNAFKLIHYRGEQIYFEQTTIWLALLALCSAGVSIFSIFSYQNRMRQIQLGMVNALLIAAILGLVVYYSFEGEKIIVNVQKGSFGAGLIIPALSLLCNSLATRFIKKDEEKVRAADRLR